MSTVIDKIRKLLRLAESPNANEAAAAAAKAQALILEHNLSAELISVDGGTSEPDEPIEDFLKKGAPLDSRPQFDRWRGELASTLCYNNGCRTYRQGGAIAIVGRPSDAETVRYLYAYLVAEVEQLCERDGKGCGRTWRNNYRLGVVDAIRHKLAEARDQFQAEQRRVAEAASSLALARINTGLARIDQRGISVRDWIADNMKLRAATQHQSAYDVSARLAGRRAGKEIVINRDNGKRLN